MGALGVLVLFTGYATFYYGVTQLQGGNWGFLDLTLPSRWVKNANTPRDGGNVGQTSTAIAPGNPSGPGGDWGPSGPSGGSVGAPPGGPPSGYAAAPNLPPGAIGRNGANVPLYPPV